MKKNKKNKQQINYLDLIPVRPEKLGWHIDGERTVMELAALQKEHFGEAAEPLYPRIVKYFQILESYHFISFKNIEK